ncbi:MAG: hypothetical protein ACI83W_002408, partial [Marinoscillum sp.]
KSSAKIHQKQTIRRKAENNKTNIDETYFRIL